MISLPHLLKFYKDVRALFKDENGYWIIRREDDRNTILSALLEIEKFDQGTKRLTQAESPADTFRVLLDACEQAEFWLAAEASNPHPGNTRPDAILKVLRDAIAAAKSPLPVR